MVKLRDKRPKWKSRKNRWQFQSWYEMFTLVPLSKWQPFGLSIFWKLNFGLKLYFSIFLVYGLREKSELLDFGHREKIIYLHWY